ncbi:hypothetical protein OKW26_004038 [Paraburkholderia sp. 32]
MYAPTSHSPIGAQTHTAVLNYTDRFGREQDCSAARLAPWRQGQPGAEMPGGPPWVEIGAAYGDETHSPAGADSMNLGEVDASKLVHEGTHGEAQRVGLLDPTAHLSQWLLRHGLTGGKHGQCALDPGIAFVNARLVEVIECQGRLQREDVFGKIVAHQGGPDRLDAGPAVAITHRSQRAGIPAAGVFPAGQTRYRSEHTHTIQPGCLAAAQPLRPPALTRSCVRPGPIAHL